MHEELSIDMSMSSSPPRLGVRFLPTIPSAADSSIILDETDSGNDNGVELLSRQDSNGSEGLIITCKVAEEVEVDDAGGNCGVSRDNDNVPVRQGNQEIVVNLANGEEYSEGEEDGDGGLKMRLGGEGVSTEKRGSRDSTAAESYQAFYTVLGNGGNTRATLESPMNGEKPP